MTKSSRIGCRPASIPGIVLASGLSRRFGPSNKLLADLHGVPVVSRTVTAYIAAGLSPVLVVVGYQAEG
ncbi:MAG: NTP transferase domain-containing protein, partial [Chloroflexi bacterium]|nr:NTP transferase domain-containing protein [Chloroflexota bacterium]